MEKDFNKHAMRASLDLSRVRDPEKNCVVSQEGNKKAISKQYNVKRRQRGIKCLRELP